MYFIRTNNNIKQHLSPLLALIIIKFITIFSTTAVAETELRVLANHLPPYMEIEEIDGKKVISGFEHELSLHLSEQLGWKLKYVECEWQTCINKLSLGEIDIVHSMLHSRLRETYVEFIEPAYLYRNYTTIFFQRFDDDRVIDEFADLLREGYVVGYLGSTVYFPELENTGALLKMDIKNRELGLKLLATGKVDVLAGFDNLFAGMEKDHPNIDKLLKKARYQPGAMLSSHTAISKRSPLFDKKAEIGKALQSLQDSGVLKKLTKKWIEGEAENPSGLLSGN